MLGFPSEHYVNAKPPPNREDNLAEELSKETIANLVPMSQFHFARAFKSLVGKPPHRYILQRRIERAKLLLTVT